MLIAAGERGCTSIDHPGPRWSDYVHDSAASLASSSKKFASDKEASFPATTPHTCCARPLSFSTKAGELARKTPQTRS